MKKTTNYNLSLYEVNDLANLTDGYNSSMNTLDATIKTVSNSVNAETTRATKAESTLTTNLNAEVTRAKAAESTLTTNLNAEVTRAKISEADLNLKISGYINLAAYINNFNGGDLNDAFSKALADYPDATAIVIPAGMYTISEPIDLSETKISNLEGVACKIKANAIMDSMIVSNSCNSFINGLNLDGNWLAKSGIKANKQATISNCFITNCTNIYISGGSQGLRLYNLRLINPKPREYHDTQGMNVGTDCLIENVYAWGFRTAFNVGANSVISTAYFWNYYSDELCVGVYSKGNVQIANVMFDCINVPIQCICNVSNMQVYVNGHDITYNNNPYYAFGKYYNELTTVNGYYLSKATDFDREIANPASGVDPSVNFISSSKKDNSNYNLIEFNLMNRKNSSNNFSTTYLPSDFSADKWYKIGELIHAAIYNIVLLVTRSVENGNFITISNAHISGNQGFLYSQYFGDNKTIRFNEDNGTLSIYIKLPNNYNNIQIFPIAAGHGCRGLFTLHELQESTITTYNRDFDR